MARFAKISHKMRIKASIQTWVACRASRALWPALLWALPRLAEGQGLCCFLVELLCMEACRRIRHQVLPRKEGLFSLYKLISSNGLGQDAQFSEKSDGSLSNRVLWVVQHKLGISRAHPSQGQPQQRNTLYIVLWSRFIHIVETLKSSLSYLQNKWKYSNITYKEFCLLGAIDIFTLIPLFCPLDYSQLRLFPKIQRFSKSPYFPTCFTFSSL